jgi:hypothetical protein
MKILMEQSLENFNVLCQVLIEERLIAVVNMNINIVVDIGMSKKNFTYF